MSLLSSDKKLYELINLKIS